MLLSRDKFRETVFSRDSHTCVVCGESAVDAHHILERRLFHDGGYYLDNGASLCGKHHIQAEQTVISCDTLRQLCGITTVRLPEQLYRDLDYDKWGNILLPNGCRVKGELFYDESVQKVLAPVLDQFSKYVKYPRTYHLPYSKIGKDDRMMEIDNFWGKDVVVTLKMDGENTTLYNDFLHARSLDSNNHPSRDWVKSLWSQVGYMLDANMRICGENLYAVHSIKYSSLSSYFQVFSIWADNVCLSWDETVEYCGILGLQTVPVIYHGAYNSDKIMRAFRQFPEHEGFVIRLNGEFTYGDFRKSVGKYVDALFRERINQSHGHWISKKLETNELI